MIKPSLFALLTLAALGVSVAAARAQTAVISVDASQARNTVTPWMTGSCLEDVNHEVYGGLYDQKIFGESFEEPPQSAQFAGWTAYGGDWHGGARGNGAQVSAGPGGKLVRNAPDFGDGIVEADVRLTGTGGNLAGLLVRVRNPGVGADAFDGYEISISASGQNVVLGKHVHNWQPLASVSAPVAPGVWHHLRVVLDGPHIRVFLDTAAAPVIDFTDPNAPLLSGQIALRTWNADAAFRNVRIQTDGQTTDVPLVATGGLSVSGMWNAVRTGTAATEFQQTSDNPFNGRFCQMIQRGTGTGVVGVANRGLNCWGIAVRQSQTFAGRIYLRGQHLQGPVTVALQSADGQKIYATARLSGIGADWRKCPFTLTSRATDPNARFAVWIDRPGTLWLDQAVLMGTGAERFHGLPIRADIANALVAEGITFLRYGGSAVNSPNYRWKNMIGNPDKRPPYAGTWYPDETNGFGIFDFLNFCEAAHIATAFAINIEETDQDAADLADYLTAPVTNPWGRRRAEDGHLAPYHPAFIEIGNEEVYDPNDHAGYLHYAARLAAQAAAIHGRNPNLKLVCAANWLPQTPDMQTVFNAANGRCAAWDVHVGSDAPDSGRGIDDVLARMQALFRQWDPQTTMKAVIFEENGGLHDMQRALGHATTVNAARRHGDFVLADCPANCLQPWQENDNGWDQGQLFFTAAHVWPMPPYFAQQMTAQAYEPQAVSCVVTGTNALDVFAARNTDGKGLSVSVVNTGDVPLTATMVLRGFSRPASPATVWTLSGPLNAVNAPTGPPAVAPVRTALPLPGPRWTQTFPARAYVVVRLTR